MSLTLVACPHDGEVAVIAMNSGFRQIELPGIHTQQHPDLLPAESLHLVNLIEQAVGSKKVLCDRNKLLLAHVHVVRVCRDYKLILFQ